MPVPPQAPQAPQGQPPQGSQPPQAPQQGGDVGKLVGGIFDGLNKLQSVMEAAKVPPNISQRLQQLVSEYQAIIEALQGGEDEGQEMSPKGPVSEEMGAGNATPM